jgi:hypothetical protein
MKPGIRGRSSRVPRQDADVMSSISAMTMKSPRSTRPTYGVATTTRLRHADAKRPRPQPVGASFTRIETTSDRRRGKRRDRLRYLVVSSGAGAADRASDGAELGRNRAPKQADGRDADHGDQRHEKRVLHLAPRTATARTRWSAGSSNTPTEPKPRDANDPRPRLHRDRSRVERRSARCTFTRVRASLDASSDELGPRSLERGPLRVAGERADARSTALQSGRCRSKGQVGSAAVRASPESAGAKRSRSSCRRPLRVANHDVAGGHPSIRSRDRTLRFESNQVRSA